MWRQLRRQELLLALQSLLLMLILQRLRPLQVQSRLQLILQQQPVELLAQPQELLLPQLQRRLARLLQLHQLHSPRVQLPPHHLYQ